MSIKSFTDARIGIGSATNQVLVHNNATGRFDYSVSLSGLTLNSPVIADDFSWTGATKTLDASSGTKFVKVANGGWAFTDMSVNALVNITPTGITFGNATNDPGFFFIGASPVTIAGNLLVNGGDIGITADPDLLQLAANLLTVNGDGDITGDLEVSGHIGVATAPVAASGILFAETVISSITGINVQPILDTETNTAQNVNGANFACALTAPSGTFSVPTGNNQNLFLGVAPVMQIGAWYGGTVTEAAYFSGRWNSAGFASNITDMYGLKLAALPTGATVANKYGVWIAAPTGAVTNEAWSIYSLGGNSAHVGNFRFGDTTVPTRQLEVIGKSSLGTPDTTDFTVDENGDSYWIGTGSGLPYGSLYLHEGAQNIDISAVGQGVYVKITGLTTGLTNLVTINSDAFNVDKIGVYRIVWQISADSAGANKDYEVDIFVNGVEQPDGSARRQFGAVGSLGSMSGSCICDITDTGHDIDIRVKEIGAGAGTDIDIFNLNFNIVMIGGT